MGCSGVLLISGVVSRFKKIGVFVRKLHKLRYKLENESNHRPVSNSAKFCGIVEIPQKWANSSAWL